MKRGRFITLMILLLSLFISVLCVHNGWEDRIDVIQNDIFCFDGYIMGTTIDEVQNREDVKFISCPENTNGAEMVYTRDFFFPKLNSWIDVFYYFDDAGLTKGMYRTIVDNKDDTVFLNSLYAYLNNMFSEDENMLNRIKSKWHYFLINFEGIRVIDQKGNVLCINRYVTNENDPSFVVEVEVYSGTDWQSNINCYGGWSDDIQICWNAEYSTNDRLLSGLSYIDVKIIRINEDAVFVDEIEGGENDVVEEWLVNLVPECVWYEIDADCNIWGLIDPASFGEVSLDELITSQMTGKEYDVWPLWSIGLDEDGKVKHIIQHYVP